MVYHMHDHDNYSYVIVISTQCAMVEGSLEGLS